MGNTHPDSPLPPPSNIGFDSPIKLSLEPTGQTAIISNGIDLEFDLIVENTTGNNDIPLYGGLITLDYGAIGGTIIDADIYIDSTSWLGTPGQDLFYIAENDTANQQLHLGFTLIDHTDEIGSGKIASVGTCIANIPIIDSLELQMITSNVSLHTSENFRLPISSEEFNFLGDPNEGLGCQNEIALVNGWNMVSTNCVPLNDSIAHIFSDIATEVTQVKNLTHFYIPALNINTFELGGHIGWKMDQGYQIKTNNASSLLIEGSHEINPQTNIIPLNTGWNIIAYWLQGNAQPIDVFADIFNDVIQIKDLASFYIPVINVGALTMQPNGGYQVKMSSSNTLQYDPSDAFRPAPDEDNINALPSHFVRNIAPNPNNAILVINAPLDGRLQYGDEIGVFTTEGILVGSAIYQNNKIGLMIYGDDETEEGKDGLATNETYIVKHWDKLEDKEYILDLIIEEGNTFYQKDDLIIASLKETTTGLTSLANAVIQLSPNPASEQLTFDVQLKESGKLLLEILDLNGCTIATVLDQHLTVGQYRIQYNIEELNNGVYLYQFAQNGEVYTERFTVIK